MLNLERQRVLLKESSSATANTLFLTYGSIRGV